MRYRAIIISMICVAGLAAMVRPDLPSQQKIDYNITIDGAGASFPNPLYQRWATDWKKSSGMTVRYDSIGSGGGQKRIKEKAVIFGASDAPMSGAELSKYDIVQFPMVTGGVVPIFHLEGFNAKDIRLDGEVLGSIFLKKITRWNDPAIVALQSGSVGKRLPDKPIKVAVREDSSGTTWVFTTYLDHASTAWKETGWGPHKFPNWKPDLRGPQNDGVAKAVKGNEGSIGYVEFAYTKKYGVDYVMLKNKSGNFVQPSLQSFTAAAENALWANPPENFALEMIDLPGERTWPIVAPTYILIRKQQTDWNAGAATLNFFEYCYTDGAKAARDLNYVPIPKIGYEAIMKNLWPKIRTRAKSCWQ